MKKPKWHINTRRKCVSCGREFIGVVTGGPNDPYCLRPCRPPKRTYRKRQWTRQAARRMARIWRSDAKRIARMKTRKVWSVTGKTEPMVEDSVVQVPIFKSRTCRLTRVERRRFCQAYIGRAKLAEAYAEGHTLQVRVLNSGGVVIGWDDVSDPRPWLELDSYESLRVKPANTVARK